MEHPMQIFYEIIFAKKMQHIVINVYLSLCFGVFLVALWFWGEFVFGVLLGFLTYQWKKQKSLGLPVDIWVSPYLFWEGSTNWVGTDFPVSLALSLVLPVPTILAFPGHQSVSTRNNFQILKHVKRHTSQNSEISGDCDLLNGIYSDIFTGYMKEFQQGHSIW